MRIGRQLWGQAFGPAAGQKPGGSPKGLTPQAGTTLMEVLVAVTLLSLLSVGILTALRVGVGALGTANKRLMDNRRVAGAQRIIEQQIAGLMPVQSPCLPGGEPSFSGKILFFQGEPQSMRFVSTFSLQDAWRGAPHILEFLVVPGEKGHGVRLIVNELPYTGPLSTGLLCVSRNLDPTLGAAMTHFQPIEASPRSFVLADRLVSCRFQFLAPPVLPDRRTPFWISTWVPPVWPLGVRVEMVPQDDDTSHLRPLSVTVPIHMNRLPEMRYEDN